MPQVTLNARSVREEPGRVTVQIKHPESAELVEFTMTRDLYQQVAVVKDEKPKAKASTTKKTTKKTTKAKKKAD